MTVHAAFHSDIKFSILAIISLTYAHHYTSRPSVTFYQPIISQHWSVVDGSDLRKKTGLRIRRVAKMTLYDQEERLEPEAEEETNHRGQKVEFRLAQGPGPSLGHAAGYACPGQPIVVRAWIQTRDRHRIASLPRAQMMASLSKAVLPGIKTATNRLNGRDNTNS